MTNLELELTDIHADIGMLMAAVATLLANPRHGKRLMERAEEIARRIENLLENARRSTMQ